jgi:hypothetical protein
MPDSQSPTPDAQAVDSDAVESEAIAEPPAPVKPQVKSRGHKVGLALELEQ